MSRSLYKQYTMPKDNSKTIEGNESENITVIAIWQGFNASSNFKDALPVIEDSELERNGWVIDDDSNAVTPLWFTGMKK